MVISLYKLIKFYTFLSLKLYLFIYLQGEGKGLRIEPATLGPWSNTKHTGQGEVYTLNMCS